MMFMTEVFSFLFPINDMFISIVLCKSYPIFKNQKRGYNLYQSLLFIIMNPFYTIERTNFLTIKGK